MKIGVDISQIVYKGTGVSRYLENLVKTIENKKDKNKWTFFCSSLRENHPLKNFPFPPRFLDLLWNKLHIFPIEWFIGKQDIFITSDWTEPPSVSYKITIIHDLIFKKFPETVDSYVKQVQKRRLELVKKESNLIIADSYSTKNDLISYYQIPDNKIKVVYPAVEIENIKNIIPFKHNKSYILAVGKIEPRKNLERLIKAFKEANLTDIDLLIVGQKGWGNQEFTNAQNIKFLGFISDAELYSLYKGAKFFIFPSLYEGFGFPLIEAMLLGCPTTCSNTSSLKELGENAALFFNPENIEEIKNCIIKLNSNEDLRNNLIKKGFIKSQEFSLNKFQTNFFEIINNINIK